MDWASAFTLLGAESHAFFHFKCYRMLIVLL